MLDIVELIKNLELAGYCTGLHSCNSGLYVCAAKDGVLPDDIESEITSVLQLARNQNGPFLQWLNGVRDEQNNDEGGEAVVIMHENS